MIQSIDITKLATDTIAQKAITHSQEQMNEFASMSFPQILDKIVNSAVDLTLKIAIAILVFYIGKFLINRIYSVVKKILVNRQVELSLSTFILSLMRIALMFILIITVIGILGIETSSFIAIFASAGVAIGMAMSGTLQNFAGGVLILFIKPYKVGDFIEVQGYSGTVKEIQIFYTIINTVDNKAIVIPNGALSTGTINNFSREEYRRVEWNVGISYGDDYEAAKKLVLEMLAKDSRVVEKYIEDDRKKYNTNATPEEEPSEQPSDDIPEDVPHHSRLWRLFHRKRKAFRQRLAARIEEERNKPEITFAIPPIDRSPYVGLKELADSSVNITIRAWTRSEFYWDLYFDINEKIYKEFPKAGLSFPFPQMDVHINNEN